MKKIKVREEREYAIVVVWVIRAIKVDGNNCKQCIAEKKMFVEPTDEQAAEFCIESKANFVSVVRNIIVTDERTAKVIERDPRNEVFV